MDYRMANRSDIELFLSNRIEFVTSIREIENITEFPESVKFHFYKNKPISVVIFYRLHTNYNQSYRSKGHTTPLEFQ